MADDLDAYGPDASEFQQLLDYLGERLQGRSDLPPPFRGLLLEFITRDIGLLGRYRAAIDALNDPTSQLAVTIRTARQGRVTALREEVRAAIGFWRLEFMQDWARDGAERRRCTWAQRNPNHLPPHQSLEQP